MTYEQSAARQALRVLLHLALQSYVPLIIVLLRLLDALRLHRLEVLYLLPRRLHELLLLLHLAHDHFQHLLEQVPHLLAGLCRHLVIL